MVIIVSILLFVGFVLVVFAAMQFCTLLFLKHFGNWNDQMRIHQNGIVFYMTPWVLPVGLLLLIVGALL